MEVFCFGGLPDGWTVETLMGKHKSIPRNQTLADVFHDAGYVENWAQGIRRVMESCEANGNSLPQFALESEGLSVTVYSNHFQQEVPQEAIVQRDVFIPTKNQELILECITSNPSITQIEISAATGLSEKAVRNNLSKMVEAGIVHRDGSKKDGKWIVTS